MLVMGTSTFCLKSNSYSIIREELEEGILRFQI